MIFGAIADDLTGAVELAGMLAAGGASVALVTRPGAVPDAAGRDAVVVALRSRVGPATEAVAGFAAAGRALLAGGARQLFFKYCATFDSTPEGNIGPCADVLDGMTGETGALFCPTFPEPGRTVYRGHHFVGDQLLSDSPKRDDPLTPMSEPNLVKVLQLQTAVRVGLIRLQTVLAGPGAILADWEALRTAGSRYAIVDAITHDDLRAIAAATVEQPLMTGGSSIAGHYPALWRAKGWIRPSDGGGLSFPSGPAVVLAGSCADQTREQIAHFQLHHPVLHLDITEADPEQMSQRAASWVTAHAGQPVCVTTAGDPAVIAAVQERLGRDAAARRAETILSRLARDLVGKGYQRLLVAGGETSGAVVEALGIEELDVAPYGQPGVGICAASHPVPLALCLKSGKLGATDLFRTVLAEMGGLA
jgi:3-dehydrotetronate 4-kinase